MPPERIVTAECDQAVLGSFETPDLTICYNNYQGNTTELRNTLVHELVHAYDFCRAKNLDFFNCKHLACTEVRVAPERSQVHVSERMRIQAHCSSTALLRPCLSAACNTLQRALHFGSRSRGTHVRVVQCAHLLITSMRS